MNSTKKRNGITGAGNWIVDNVKVIDRLPARGMLGNILSETRGTGGAAFNTLVDLEDGNALPALRYWCDWRRQFGRVYQAHLL